MTNGRETDYGRVIVAPREELFAQAVALAAAQQARTAGRSFTWALSGGSTPQEWYRWCVAGGAFSPALREAHFTVSDERHVPLASPQSNFGNAERLLLAPLGIPPAHRHPWPVAPVAARAAAAYRERWREVAGPGRAYDVCMLGLGDDAHTASFFPGSPLLADATDPAADVLPAREAEEWFAAIATADKGWRLTVTPAGLRACGLVVVMTFGAAKAPALRRVFHGAYEPTTTPAQILRACAARVVWLVDPAAAAGLETA